MDRFRMAGMVPHGRPGRNGAGSAVISARSAIMITLALACRARPVDAPAEAEALAAYRLGRGGMSLSDRLVGEIERAAADPAYRVAALLIEPGRAVTTIEPADLLRPRPRLRLVAGGRERLEFVPATRPPAHDAQGRPFSLGMVLRPEVLHGIAGLFVKASARTLLSRPLPGAVA